MNSMFTTIAAYIGVISGLITIAIAIVSCLNWIWNRRSWIWKICIGLIKLIIDIKDAFLAFLSGLHNFIRFTLAVIKTIRKPITELSHELKRQRYIWCKILVYTTIILVSRKEPLLKKIKRRVSTLAASGNRAVRNRSVYWWKTYVRN